MTEYNARIDYTRPAPSTPDDQWTGDVLDALAGFSPVLSHDQTGRTTTLVLTFPATDLRTAVTTALALARDATGIEPVGVEVVTTEVFDRRHGLGPLPELLSVTQVATALGVSRQAVLQRLTAGTLPGTRVGEAWAVPASAVRAG